MQLKNKQGKQQKQNAHTYKHPIATNKKPKTIHTRQQAYTSTAKGKSFIP